MPFRSHFTLSKYSSQNYNFRPSTYEPVDQRTKDGDFQNKNELQLPPRTTKPKLIDKPRHIRKYPLKLPNTPKNINTNVNNDHNDRLIIYQNTVSCSMKERNCQRIQEHIQHMHKNGVDVFDGPETVKVDTNPFTNVTGQGSVNPFNCYLETIDNEKDYEPAKERKQYFEERSFVKDHVSVEDLLEFADQKPCGRQRGVESDEVRIMNKVLKQQATPEECLEALELSDWNVHHAIKMIRVKITVGDEVSVTLEECSRELANSAGDIVKASAMLVLCKNNDI
ncbi:uncharacterized protein [Battus philenor]|uniref:uncharacterized protein n=1 Tax=Battus philenor TaxID=42288 RepID=UPI0035D0E86F